jgi:CheY-like chemotaxis protein
MQSELSARPRTHRAPSEADSTPFKQSNAGRRIPAVTRLHDASCRRTRQVRRDPLREPSGAEEGTLGAVRVPCMTNSRQFRVLVAEDDVQMRGIVADALRDDGYDVVELADGGRLLVDIAARMKAEDAAESVDLIVSDIRMPICTGLQILEVLRRSHWRTPVILMTAFGDDATRRLAESFMAVLLDKPFDLEDLRSAVAHLLPHRSVQ